MCEHPQRVSFVPFPDVRTRVPGFWPISPWPSDTIKAKIEFQEVNQPRFSWFGFPLLCLLLGGCRIQVELHMNFKSLDHTYIYTHIQSHTYIPESYSIISFAYHTQLLEGSYHPDGFMTGSLLIEPGNGKSPFSIGNSSTGLRVYKRGIVWK
jgi:hypothetical protein